MTMVSLPEHRRLLVALLAGGAIGFCGAGLAAESGTKSPSTPVVPADDARPVPPSRSELPDSAFKKLDSAGKGYVTRDDTRELQGFDPLFQQNDRNHDGKLMADEFTRAWNTYAVKP